MHRFFRFDLTTLFAVALIAAPLATRAAAQTAQPADVDAAIAVAAAGASAARDSTAPPVDLRAIERRPASPDAAGTASASAGVSMTGLRSAVHAREAAGPRVVTAQRANLGQSQAMMIVGGAALITGAIIGGDPGTIIMVGGAVVGLYGLYQYLQ